MHASIFKKISLPVTLFILAACTPFSAFAAVTINVGAFADVHWFANGAASCTKGIAGPPWPGANVQTQWSGNTPSNSGTQTLGPFGVAGTFVFTCTAGGDVGSDVVTVKVVFVAPTINTVSAITIATSTATIRGTGDPNGFASTGWFRYSTINDAGLCLNTFGSSVPAVAIALGLGTTPVAFSHGLTGLLNETTYYFCALGNNAGGNDGGTIMSFKTLAPPSVNTTAATSITSTGARINGNGDPSGSATTASFRYGTNNVACGSLPTPTTATTPGSGALGSGTASVSFSRVLTGLIPSTTYYYCARATNASGADNGTVLSFTTNPPAATVTARVNGATSDTIASEDAFTLTMSSTNASSCTWSRTSVLNPLGGDFGASAIPGANGGPYQFNANNNFSGWVGPSTVTWTYACSNITGGDSESVTLTILAPVPAITVTGGPNSFLNTIVGNTSTRTFTVRNTGQTASQLTGAVTPSLPAEFYCTAGCTYTNLTPASADHFVTITFVPGAVGGRSGSVTFSGPALGATCNGIPGNTCTMTGNGLTPILFTPDPLNFGQVVITKKKTMLLNMRNISTSDITSAFRITGIGGVFSCDSGCGYATLNAGASRSLSITFVPDISWTAVTGISGWGTLDGPGRTEAFEIRGTGVPPVWSVVEE
jgi:hypothetical protein